MKTQLHRFLMMAVLSMSLWLAAGSSALAAELVGSGPNSQATSKPYPAEGHIHRAGGAAGGVLSDRWHVVAGGMPGGVLGDRWRVVAGGASGGVLGDRGLLGTAR